MESVLAPKVRMFLLAAMQNTGCLRIVRGILLKGNTFVQLWPELWPMLLFLFAAGALALMRYRQTLD
jgi:ABC-2 type transport system permease protein